MLIIPTIVEPITDLVFGLVGIAFLTFPIVLFFIFFILLIQSLIKQIRAVQLADLTRIQQISRRSVILVCLFGIIVDLAIYTISYAVNNILTFPGSNTDSPPIVGNLIFKLVGSLYYPSIIFASFTINDYNPVILILTLVLAIVLIIIHRQNKIQKDQKHHFHKPILIACLIGTVLSGLFYILSYVFGIIYLLVFLEI
ncbi:MAG: hypothetical protein WCV88_03390 [Patescibacteria group bacterium]